MWTFSKSILSRFLNPSQVTSYLHSAFPFAVGRERRRMCRTLCTCCYIDPNHAYCTTWWEFLVSSVICPIRKGSGWSPLCPPIFCLRKNHERKILRGEVAEQMCKTVPQVTVRRACCKSLEYYFPSLTRNVYSFARLSWKTAAVNLSSVIHIHWLWHSKREKVRGIQSHIYIS